MVLWCDDICAFYVLMFFCLLLMPTTLGISWSRNCFFLLICPFVLHITHSCLPNVKFVYCMYGQYNKTFLLSSISYYNPLNTGHRTDMQIPLGPFWTLYDIQTRSTIWTSNHNPTWRSIWHSPFEIWTWQFFIGHVNIYNKCREYTHLIT